MPPTTDTLLDTAAQRIANEGLNRDVTLISSGIIGADRVVRTVPPAGTVVPPGSLVEILVSTGLASSCPNLFANSSASIGIDGSIQTDAEGNPIGFEPELIRALIDQMCGFSIRFSYATVSAASRFAAVGTGKIDLLPTSKRSGDVSLLYTTPHILLDGATPRGLAVRDGLNTERLQLNAALLEVIDSGRWLELHQKWLGEPGYTINDMLSTPLAED